MKKVSFNNSNTSKSIPKKMKEPSSNAYENFIKTEMANTYGVNAKTKRFIDSVPGIGPVT